MKYRPVAADMRGNIVMKAKTYDGNEVAFAEDWKVIHVR